MRSGSRAFVIAILLLVQEGLEREVAPAGWRVIWCTKSDWKARAEAQAAWKPVETGCAVDSACPVDVAFKRHATAAD